MKPYIGNKTICLAQVADREDTAGYEVLYSDGSETWLTKEIFEFEFRELDETEIQMIISTIVETDLSDEQLKSIIDWDDLSEEDQQVVELDLESNPDNYEIVGEEIDEFDNNQREENVEDAK